MLHIYSSIFINVFPSSHGSSWVPCKVLSNTNYCGFIELGFFSSCSLIKSKKLMILYVEITLWTLITTSKLSYFNLDKSKTQASYIYIYILTEGAGMCFAP